MPLENDYYKGDYKSSQLYKLKGPSRTPIIAPGPNVAPLATTPIPDDTEQTSGGDNLGNLLSLAMTLKGGGSPGSIPGQLPGTEFNMGAVNMPEPSPLNPQTSSKEFDADKFARMAGAFGAASLLLLLLLLLGAAGALGLGLGIRAGLGGAARALLGHDGHVSGGGGRRRRRASGGFLE